MTNQQAALYASRMKAWGRSLSKALQGMSERERDIEAADPPLSDSSIQEIAVSGQAAIQRILDEEPTRESVINELNDTEVE